MNGCYLVWSPLTVVEGWSEFCQKNGHQGAWRTCQGGVEDARNPVTEAVSDIEAGATIILDDQILGHFNEHTA